VMIQLAIELGMSGQVFSKISTSHLVGLAGLPRDWSPHHQLFVDTYDYRI